MNGQTNENQPIQPNFGGSSSISGSAPLNPGGIGFNNQSVSSGWPPNAAVSSSGIGDTTVSTSASTPAPIPSPTSAPVSIPPISTPVSVPTSVPIPPTPAPVPVSIPPTPAPVPLNDGGIGFNNQPIPSGWSPGIAPVPGPISSASAPFSVPSQTSAPLSSVPPMSPVSAPGIGVISSAPAPAPTPTPPIGQFMASSSTAFQPAAVSPTAFARQPVDSIPSASSVSQYEIKTLASDAETLKASGGMETSPQTFNPAPMSGEEFFNPVAASATVIKKKGINKMLFIVGAVVVVIGLAVAGFVFIRPLLITPAKIPEAILVTPPPVIQEIPDIIPTPVLPDHTSFFTTPANVVERGNMEAVTIESLKALFLAPEGSVLADGAIRELVIFTAGAPLAFSSFLSTMLPDILPGGIETAFEGNFTLFVYKDGANNMPGFIAKVKTGVSPETLSAISTTLEASPNLGNFYAVSPGVRSAFRAGGFNGNPTRFATFAAGHIFNYGWFKDAAGATYLVAATSYKGIIEAVARTGL